ncbi:unnamed protein product [Paramecium primaurelia]|uniref:PSI domain-containing protein n=1 Tax=Paramecium primaurelia TaxID=5886 RepID=A0A8S1MZ68_PARPR|nr:unnamed protein product [Paramecium primaurelia]
MCKREREEPYRPQQTLYEKRELWHTILENRGNVSLVAQRMGKPQEIIEQDILEIFVECLLIVNDHLGQSKNEAIIQKLKVENVVSVIQLASRNNSYYTSVKNLNLLLNMIQCALQQDDLEKNLRDLQKQSKFECLFFEIKCLFWDQINDLSDEEQQQIVVVNNDAQTNGTFSDIYIDLDLQQQEQNKQEKKNMISDKQFLTHLNKIMADKQIPYWEQVVVRWNLIANLSCDYYQSEIDCIQNNNQKCRWNEITSQCLYTDGVNFGCSNLLSSQSCIVQTYYPDGTMAECIFSGYCRKVTTLLSNCSKNLSRAACLAVQDDYCFWNDSCQTISEAEANNIAWSASDSIELVSVKVCRLITASAVLHQSGAHVVLNAFYKSSLLSNQANTYKELMLIPGCVKPPDQVYLYLRCSSAGLNKLGCIKIQTESCIFVDGKCQQVEFTEKLKCSDALNQLACLSVTNFSETCYWSEGYCQYKSVKASDECSFDIQVSPSVCANVSSISCFYDSQSKRCNSMCKSQSNMKTETSCRQSSSGCIWNDVNGCLFDDNEECGKLGQNQLSCNEAIQNCQFIDGQCLKIMSLDQLKCTSGLNKISCLNLKNPSQVCYYNGLQCKIFQVTPETMCGDLTSHNPNACRKVTTEACYWSDGKCKTTDGSLTCEQEGLNRLGCLNSTMSSCKWNEFSGMCMSISIKRTDECSTLKLVNAVACRMVNYIINFQAQLCKYNSETNNCETFIMNNSIRCDTIGMNQKGCSSVTNSSLSCRWLSNQCSTVESLGGAVTCSSLQSVTSKTCAMVQQVVEKCRYDSNIQSCSASVDPNTICTASGLNPYACAYLKQSCYFDTINQQCITATDFTNIKCDKNFPSKSTCLAISLQGQYCIWNSIDSICQLQEFPVSNECSQYKNVNKLFCLAYEISQSKWVGDKNYCTYNGTTQQCQLYTSATDWADCGSNLDINLHACIKFSNKSLNCYFNTTSLKCLEITLHNDPLLNSLLCKQCNQKLCSSITTSGQYCLWVSSAQDIKCKLLTTGSECSSYLNEEVNSNTCASTKSVSSCRFNPSTKACVIIDNSVNNLSCDTSGLNEQACITNTTGPCYFDKKDFRCSEVTNDSARRISCRDSVNKLGCLASQKEACYWDEGNNKCQNVSDIDYDTVTCASLNNQLYNAIVCAMVNTQNEMCEYNQGTYHCDSIQMNSSCKIGQNEAACELNSSCDTFNSHDYMCQSKPSPPQSDCNNKNTDNDCIGVTTSSCGWFNNTCVSIKIDQNSQCNQFNISSGGKFNSMICSQIQSSSCGYDSINKVCISITSTNNPCDTSGLNIIGCIQNTKGSYCGFWQNKCQVINDITMINGNFENLNEDACVDVQKVACQFDKQTKLCSEISESTLMNFNCSSYSDSNSKLVNSKTCKYANSNQSCIYDSVNHICKVETIPLSLCTSNSSINSVYCLNYVSQQTCEFSSYTCSVITSTEFPCPSAVSFKQCINSRVFACKWENNECVYITPNNDCTTLTNINSYACMQNNYQNQSCQFQDNGLSSQCIIPSNTLQSCDGLNKIACINNTLNSCYYYQICIDITTTPYEAECTSDFSFTQSACIRIQTPKQLCQWNNGSCIAITTQSTDSCNTYSSNVYSPQVCASIQTEPCYWNNGCVTANAPNCNSIGANQKACAGALSGNCIFTNNLCLDVLINDVTSSKCSDPSNQNGCLKLYNGQSCQWINNTCSSITVNNNCLSYSQVNPGVCSQTTDIPCIWNANSCQAVTVASINCDKGMNKLACVGYTSAYCYYKNGMCMQVNDYTNLDCSSNLNENACKAHTLQCCQWISNQCVSSNYQITCNSMSNYSKYCCQQQIGGYCTYTTTCTTLASQNSRCQEAINKTACLWLLQPCIWDDTNLLCSPVSRSQGCVDNLNAAGCVTQEDFCMYDENTKQCILGQITSCNALKYSSLSELKCLEVTDVGCTENTNHYGCLLTGINAQCQIKMNKIGCINNINSCQWDSDEKSCKNMDTKNQPPNCPGIGQSEVSRGYCSNFTGCRLDTNNQCVPIDNNTQCDLMNSISVKNSMFCQKSTLTDPCQFKSTELRCSTTITGSVCNDIVNSIGCKYIESNCIWNNGSCVDVPSNTIFRNCPEITSRYTCLHNLSTACKWDSTNHLCITYSGEMKPCSNYVDTLISPGICYFFSTDYCAHNGSSCYLENEQSICNLSFSPLGCQNNKANNCYWNIQQGICLQLADETLAKDMTCPLFKYSQKRFCVAPINEGQICHWTNNQCRSADTYEVSCTSELSLYGCLAVAKENEKCIYKDDKCQYIDNLSIICSDHLNIYGCVNVTQEGQFCKWLGQQCSQLDDSDYQFEIDYHILINQHVCRRAYTIKDSLIQNLENISVKYDNINYICIYADNEIDLCDTKGLNYFGCLKTKADRCDWVNNKCVNYSNTIEYSTCEEYQTVSPRVCSSITSKNLKCYHDSITLSCKTFVETTLVFKDFVSTLNGLNRLACLSITQQPTIWLNEECQYNTIINGVTQCYQLKNVNPVSCSLIDVDDVICKYLSDGQCTTIFDSKVDTCKTTGLNKLGCILIENEKCQFVDYKCQYYDGNISVCNNLVNVNLNVCKALNTQGCKFSYLSRGCVDVYSNDTCDSPGINQIGCMQLQNCKYINTECICSGLVSVYEIIDCTIYSMDKCTASQCIYDMQLSICRNKVCNDISLDVCDSTKINKYQCFKNKSQCQSASKCSDLFNVSDCTKFKINNKKCNVDIYNQNHCIEQNCIHYTQDQCSGNCMWSYYECQLKLCKYMKKEECTGYFNNEQCIWYDNQCIGVNSCEEFIQYTNQDSQESICNQQQIGGKQCYWLQIQSFSNKYSCISQLCQQFGSSANNCNGAEIQQQLCVLLPNNQCTSCNEITDACTCMNMGNYCFYNQQSGCQSNLCQYMDQSLCELSNDRCIYVDNQCKQLCTKLQIVQCKQRNTDCHWNSNTLMCQEGIETEISINTLSDVIEIETSQYSSLITITSIILFLYI